MDELTVLTWRVPHAPAAHVEAAALPVARVDELVRAIRDEAGAKELVYVPTCQRVVLAMLHAPDDADARVLKSYEARLGRRLAPPERYRGEAAFRHLAETASSLDSLVVGEPQVLGQFKSAARRSEEVGVAASGMRHVMSLVFRAAKAVRSETALFQGRVSLVPLTTKLIDEHLAGKTAPSVAVLGTGEVGQRMLDMLRARPGLRIHVVSRAGPRAEEVAAAIGATPHALDAFLARPPEGLDVVALAMPADEPILRASHLERISAGRDVLVLDLAVPRNVEPSATPDARVRVVQMDDLARVRDDALSARAGETDAARAVLDRELDRIRTEYEMRKLAHDLQQLTKRFEEVAAERWERAPADMRPDEARRWYDQTVRALLHEAAAAVKRAGCRERGS